MNQLVQNYIEKKENEKKELETKERNQVLIGLGLYEKIYSDSDEYSSEFSESEWDSKDNKTKYYKKVPVQISDEEYKTILKYQQKKTKKNNSVATVFKVIAWFVFIIGFIFGIVSGLSAVELFSDSDFNITVALAYWSVSFVSGMIFIGIAEIIQLLTDIKNK